MRITPPPSPRATMTSAPATPAQPSSRMIRPKAMRMLSGIWTSHGIWNAKGTTLSASLLMKLLIFPEVYAAFSEKCVRLSSLHPLFHTKFD